ncbi:MAG: hypothetical protein ACKO0V_19720, partial [bacterium]
MSGRWAGSNHAGIPLNRLHRSILSHVFSFLILCIVFIFGQSPELGAADGAVKWSPDGQWLAMRQEFTNQFSPLETSGWLFRPELFLRENAPEKLSVRQSSIWIGRTDLKAWYKVAETGNRFEFLSQPCWALDGLSLYYAAVEKTGKTGKIWRIYQLGDLNDISNPQIVWEKVLPAGWAVPEPGQKLRMILSRIQAGAENQMIFADAAAGELVLFRASSG